MKTTTQRISVFLFSLTLLLDLPAQESQGIPLWPDGAPGATGTNAIDIPTLTPFIPQKPNGTSIVICPGGGYGGLAPHEGQDYALYLNKVGITGFVLKYRLAPAYHHPSMMQDVNRAIRWVRAKAGDWKLDPSKVGVMGSSAGGHLASTAVTHFDEGNPRSTDSVEWHSSRPDFGVLCYPVISMGEWTHLGSKRNLIGENPPSDLVWLMSNELQVTPRTSPCFIWHTQEDNAVPVEGALLFALAMQRAKVPLDLHVYQQGRHGIGLAAKPPEFTNAHPWAKDLVYWLQQHNWADVN